MYPHLDSRLSDAWLKNQVRRVFAYSPINVPVHMEQELIQKKITQETFTTNESYWLSYLTLKILQSCTKCKHLVTHWHLFKKVFHKSFILSEGAENIIDSTPMYCSHKEKAKKKNGILHYIVYVLPYPVIWSQNLSST